MKLTPSHLDHMEEVAKKAADFVDAFRTKGGIGYKSPGALTIERLVILIDAVDAWKKAVDIELGPPKRGRKATPPNPPE